MGVNIHALTSSGLVKGFCLNWVYIFLHILACTKGRAMDREIKRMQLHNQAFSEGPQVTAELPNSKENFVMKEVRRGGPERSSSPLIIL